MSVERSTPANGKIHVLFVCLGNICRSPTAEAVFRRAVQLRKLDRHFEIDSAGTGAWHAGEPPDARAQLEARKNGITMKGMFARQVEPHDYARFHYILAMDNTNLRDMLQECPEEHRPKVYRFTDFAPHLGVEAVPDPYYGGPNGFEHVFHICEEGANGLLDTIIREHGLQG